MAGDEVALRPVDVETDLDAIAELVIRSQAEATGSSDTDRERVRADLTSPLAARDEHRLAVLDGEPVGVLIAEVDAESREVFAEISAVGPARAEVLARLVSAGRECTVRHFSEDPAELADGVDPYVLSADFWQFAVVQADQDGVFAEVLAEAGLRSIRSFWRMALDVRDAPDEPPAPPTGVTRRAASGEDDWRLVHALDQEAFAEHFGFLHSDPFETWMGIVVARSGYDPDRCWIVERDGRAVGFCMLDNSLASFGEDYVGAIGVLKPARGQGIARWLLQCAAVEARQRGRSHLCLSVDGANATGATALYESVGFVTRRRTNLWLEPIGGSR